MSRGAPMRVFAIEDTTVQVCWGEELRGPVVVSAGEARAEIETEGRPGAATLTGLRPGAAHDLTVEISGTRGLVERFRTLDPPPGELLCRFATISDMHVGERSFGMLPRFYEDLSIPREKSYAVRCARAAIEEATAWGASSVLAKGDLTWSGRAWQWDLVASVFQASSVPVHAILGNHDVGPRGVDARAAMARHGIDISARPITVDLPGIRVVMGHTADAGHERGAVDPDQRAEIAELVQSAAGPAFLAMHHYVDRLPMPSRYPVGVRRGPGTALLRAVADANPRVFVSFGHTHRCRRGERLGIPFTEVGSTKDYPGVWAGYAVHEGGIRQVVRRVSEPSCMAWTEPIREVMAGSWGWWSPGRRRWRCFSHSWK